MLFTGETQRELEVMLLGAVSLNMVTLAFPTLLPSPHCVFLIAV